MNVAQPNGCVTSNGSVISFGTAYGDCNDWWYVIIICVYVCVYVCICVCICMCVYAFMCVSAIEACT